MAEYQGKRFKNAAGGTEAPGAGAHRAPQGAAGRAAGSQAAGAHAAPAPGRHAVSGQTPAQHAAPVQGARFKRPASADAPAPRVSPAPASQQAGTRFKRSAPAGTPASAPAHTAAPSPAPAAAPSHTAASPQAPAATRVRGVVPVGHASAAPRATAGSGGGAVPPVKPSRYGAGSADGDRGDGSGRRRRRILPKLLVGIGVLLLLVAGGMLIHTLWGYHQAEETYGSLAEYAPVSDTENSGIPVVDFDALQEINPDIVGWIYVPGTNINYPVAQGDDNTTYLNRLFDGTTNSSGSIFLDADATAPGMVDQQTPVYGHHMNNQSMFYEIDDTVDQAAFDGIEAVYYITRDATYRCTPLMTCVIDETFLEARQATFTDAAAFTAYLEEMHGFARAEADDAADRIASAQQVLTLITCSGELPGPDRTVMVLTLDETIPNP
ncbi:class B sortase [Collinsella intestinalis]|uniref:class B sortase n=1 Tax=Collinsella intestinalis TaxID=147207 RepID=UPI0025A47609|nr:sortase [Collinsella intestinalis]MDM8163644.1 sortase [Collinsella intestinalis]